MKRRFAFRSRQRRADSPSIDVEDAYRFAHGGDQWLEVRSRVNVQIDVCEVGFIHVLDDGHLGSHLPRGRVLRHHEAHLELYRYYQDADSTIRGFCAIIRKLPEAQRKLWDNAIIREFNIGIRAGMKPNTFEIAVDEEAVRQAADINARIGITIYSPAMKDSRSGVSAIIT